jgi:hypothetical protein
VNIYIYYCFFQVSLETLSHLESTADELAKMLSATPLPTDSNISLSSSHNDRESLCIQVTTAKTDIVALRTDAEKLRSMVEEYVRRRRKRTEELGRHQSVMRRIQVWLNGAKAKTSTEVKMYSADDVAENVDVNEVSG